MFLKSKKKYFEENSAEDTGNKSGPPKPERAKLNRKESKVSECIF